MSAPYLPVISPSKNPGNFRTGELNTKSADILSGDNVSSLVILWGAISPLPTSAPYASQTLFKLVGILPICIMAAMKRHLV